MKNFFILDLCSFNFAVGTVYRTRLFTLPWPLNIQMRQEQVYLSVKCHYNLFLPAFFSCAIGQMSRIFSGRTRNCNERGLSSSCHSRPDGHITLGGNSIAVINLCVQMIEVVTQWYFFSRGSLIGAF